MRLNRIGNIFGHIARINSNGYMRMLILETPPIGILLDVQTRQEIISMNLISVQSIILGKFIQKIRLGI